MEKNVKEFEVLVAKLWIISAVKSNHLNLDFFVLSNVYRYKKVTTE